jgi:hypothetical protein
MTDRGPVGGLEFGSSGQYGQPQIVQASGLTGTTVRVCYDQEMKHINPANIDDVLNPSNYAFVVTGGVSIIALSVALNQANPTEVDITLNNEMTAGSNIEVTVANVLSKIDQLIDPAYDTFTFAGFGYKPQVQSATAIDGVIVELIFNEVMSAIGLSTPGNYTIEPGPNPPLVVYQVDIKAANKVWIWTTTPQVIGGSYTLLVANVKDLAENPIDDPPNDRGDFVGVAVTTKLDSVEVLTDTKIRLHFSKPMLKDNDLLDVNNYILIPITPGAAPLYFSQILTPTATYPEYVDIPMSEMTDAKIYNAEVSTSIKDRWSNNINSFFKDKDFTGEGTPPIISTVVASSSTRVLVTFNELMKDNADIRNPSKYSFDHGLQVLVVLDVLGNTVTLSTSEQTPGMAYTLTVIP